MSYTLNVIFEFESTSISVILHDPYKILLDNKCLNKYIKYLSLYLK